MKNNDRYGHLHMTLTDRIQSLFDKRVSSVLVAGLLLATPVHAEKNCSLVELASFPIVMTSNGVPSISITIDGIEKQFAVSMTEPVSWIAVDLQNERNFIVRRIAGSSFYPTFLNFGNQAAVFKAYVPEIKLGQASIKNTQMLILQRPPASGLSGLLGLDVFSRFDVELNLKQKKLNLFFPHACSDAPVYWGRPYEVLPMAVSNHGYREYEMQLDGQQVLVALNIESDVAAMGLVVAKSLFGLTPGDPRLKPLAKLSGNSKPEPVTTDIAGMPNAHLVAIPPKSGDTYYDYTFAALSLQGLNIKNLHTTLFPQDEKFACVGGRKNFHTVGPFVVDCLDYSDLALGRHELSALRLYFAFAEKQLYVTAADPDAKDAPPSPNAQSAPMGQRK